MLDKAEDQKERDQKESQEQHSSLADSRMMTISKFAWDEKVEGIRQLREERDKLQSWLRNAEAKEREYDNLRHHFDRLEKEHIKLVKELEWYRDKSDAYVTSYITQILVALASAPVPSDQR